MATPGDAIDYAFIKQTILDDAQRFKVAELNVDRLFESYGISSELTEEGLAVFGMGQGFLSMAGPMKEFERRLIARKLNHGGHPVLRWMAGNVAVKQDPAGNFKPDKAQSQGKIDGIVALVMALDRAIAGALGYVVGGWNASGLPAGSLGFVYLPALAGIVIGSVLTAPLGARTAHRLPVRPLKRLFALLLVTLALRMAWTF